jgi:hypothetical protein
MPLTLLVVKTQEDGLFIRPFSTRTDYQSVLQQQAGNPIVKHSREIKAGPGDRLAREAEAVLRLTVHEQP